MKNAEKVENKLQDSINNLAEIEKNYNLSCNIASRKYYFNVAYSLLYGYLHERELQCKEFHDFVNNSKFLSRINKSLTDDTRECIDYFALVDVQINEIEMKLDQLKHLVTNIKYRR